MDAKGLRGYLRAYDDGSVTSHEVRQEREHVAVYRLDILGVGHAFRDAQKLCLPNHYIRGFYVGARRVQQRVVFGHIHDSGACGHPVHFFDRLVADKPHNGTPPHLCHDLYGARGDLLFFACAFSKPRIGDPFFLRERVKRDYSHPARQRIPDSQRGVPRNAVSVHFRRPEHVAQLFGDGLDTPPPHPGDCGLKPRVHHRLDETVPGVDVDFFGGALFGVGGSLFGSQRRVFRLKLVLHPGVNFCLKLVVLDRHRVFDKKDAIAFQVF